MQEISQQDFYGERPLFNHHHVTLKNSTIHEGESALKECSDIVAQDCTFIGRYPFWHNTNTKILNCHLTVDCRAPLWYDRNIVMQGCRSEAPKMLREVDNVKLIDCDFPDAQELLWKCRNVEVHNTRIGKADYIFFNSDNLQIDGLTLQGKYSFQYCHNIHIKNSVLNTKDAFWESADILIENSQVLGEYLAWHSTNLTLVRCHIAGSQPLCYAHNLKLIDCTFDADADLAFEYSSVQATIQSPVTSVKNPLTGFIKAKSFGEIILDENQKEPHDCKIELLD